MVGYVTFGRYVMIAITAASGELGSRTVAAVIEQGFPPDRLVVCVRTPEKMAAWAEKGVVVRPADYEQPETLEAAFEGVERVLLVPSIAPSLDRVRQYENVIEAARQAGVGHIIHYGLVPVTVDSPFLVTPFLVYAESAIRTSGLDWTILRNSLYMDPIADWVPNIIEMGTIPYPTGEGRCSYISRDDIARAGAAALTTDGHEGQVYHLTGPQSLTTADLCDVVSRITGKPVTDRNASDQDYIDVCMAEGESEWLTHALLTLYHTIRKGLLDVESDGVERLTGIPAESFESYLQSRLDS